MNIYAHVLPDMQEDAAGEDGVYSSRIKVFLPGDPSWENSSYGCHNALGTLGCFAIHSPRDLDHHLRLE